MLPSLQKGTLWAVMALGVVSFAFSPILVRWAGATGSGAPALAIVVWRTGLSAGLLAPVALWRARGAWRALSRRDVALTAGAGVLLGLHFIFWVESLYHTSVASSTVLVTTSPIVLALLGYLLLKERLSAGVVGAIVAAVAGAGLIAYGDAAQAAVGSLWGNSLALVASLLVSFYLLIGRVVRQRVGWLAYVFPLYAAAALTALGGALWRGVPLLGYDAAFYGLCLAMALGPQLLGHGAFNYALQYVPAALVGMLALLEPVGASLLAYLLFDEAPTALAVGGMGVVLASTAAVVLLRRRGSAEEAQPEETAG